MDSVHDFCLVFLWDLSSNFFETYLLYAHVLWPLRFPHLRLHPHLCAAETPPLVTEAPTGAVPAALSSHHLLGLFSRAPPAKPSPATQSWLCSSALPASASSIFPPSVFFSSTAERLLQYFSSPLDNHRI